jgi:hypothetical protein
MMIGQASALPGRVPDLRQRRVLDALLSKQPLRAVQQPLFRLGASLRLCPMGRWHPFLPYTSRATYLFIIE